MRNVETLKVQKRDVQGKGAMKKIRATKMLPGVIYGNKQAPVMIEMDPRELEKQWRIPGFKTRQFEIDVNGTKELTLCHDIQFHKVSDQPIHVDFLRIDPKKSIKLEIPVRFENEEICKGIKAGGVLNIVRRELEVECKVSNIPSEILIDIANLEAGHSLHCSDITLPEGVKLVEEGKFTIATISAPMEEEVVSTTAPTTAEVPATKVSDKEKDAK